ncbi:hypothetical protein J2X14_003952 [Pantoea alhagi]|nr:hypothetical protein [Pantoea alhagi]
MIYHNFMFLHIRNMRFLLAKVLNLFISGIICFVAAYAVICDNDFVCKIVLEMLHYVRLAVLTMRGLEEGVEKCYTIFWC